MNFNFILKLNSVCLDSQKGYGPYWALTTAAALYWRVKGNAHAAITCLIQSLDHAPRHMEVISRFLILNRPNFLGRSRS